MSCDLVRPEDVIQVGEVSDVTVPGGDGERPARLYRPEGEGPWATTLFLHGGGFVIGDLDTHDQACRRLCRDAETVVLSVDYRLAPEHPFPAGGRGRPRRRPVGARSTWTSSAATTGWPSAGDSAGGNLAAVVAQTMPERDHRPAADLPGRPTSRATTPSRVENAEGYFLELAMMEWFFLHYVTGVEGLDPHDPRLSPLRAASLAGQPPAVVVTAELDPLRDEGEAYADRLEADGVTGRAGPLRRHDPRVPRHGGREPGRRAGRGGRGGAVQASAASVSQGDSPAMRKSDDLLHELLGVRREALHLVPRAASSGR